MTKLASVADSPVEIIGGVSYRLRTATCYDLPKMRWRLTRARVRRPVIDEYRVCALAGVAAIAELAGVPEEGRVQADILERWYKLLPEPTEDNIEEVDAELRAALLAEQLAEREQAMDTLLPSVLAIEANLDRHWQDWAELRADAQIYDDISRIDAARLMLVAVGDETLPRVADGDERGLVTEAAFLAIPAAARAKLGTVALGLLAPTETERKN